MTADFTGKRVLIWGAARSGQAAARLLRPLAAEVALADDASADTLRSNLHADLGDVPLIAGDGSCGSASLVRPVTHWDLVVVSPGVPSTHPHLAKAADAGVPVLSELEVGSRFARGHLVAITGTNGKTTTVTLAGHLLGGEEAGVFVAGNVGQAICEVMQRPAARSPEATLVLEVSSFQCEHLERFHPQVAVVLNLRPDHLDRHGDTDNYRSCKAAMGRNLTDEDIVILNADDAGSQDVARAWRGRRLMFGLDRSAEHGVWVEGNAVIFREGTSRETLLCLQDLRVPGRHNFANALAAAAVARCCGVAPAAIAARVRTFPGVRHRTEWVACVHGVDFINDSKATNLDSLAAALGSFPSVVLIAGGRSKGENPARLRRMIDRHARALVLMGETANALEAAWGDQVEQIERAADLAEAVARARHLARRGEAVLFSPGHPSFDLFSDFEDRGDQFCCAVREQIGVQEVHP